MAPGRFFTSRRRRRGWQFSVSVLSRKDGVKFEPLEIPASRCHREGGGRYGTARVSSVGRNVPRQDRVCFRNKFLPPELVTVNWLVFPSFCRSNRCRIHRGTCSPGSVAVDDVAAAVANSGFGLAGNGGKEKQSLSLVVKWLRYVKTWVLCN